MTHFNDILKANALQDQSLVNHVRRSLENENFSPLMEVMQPALNDLYKENSENIEHVSKVFENIHNYPRKDWDKIFTIVMDEIIGKMDYGKTAFFDTNDFPWVEKVESLYDNILSEFQLANNNIDILPAFQEFHEQQSNLSQDDKWKVLVFQFYGERLDKNLEFFPSTAALLEHIPGWTSGMFSILAPGKKIPPHCGPYKGVLRYHLGLQVPENCGINVKGEENHWHEGKSLVFDDTFSHFAWNNSDRERSVLFVDFIRPLLFPLNILNEWVIHSVIYNSDFVQKDTNMSTFSHLINTLADR